MRFLFEKFDSSSSLKERVMEQLEFVLNSYKRDAKYGNIGLNIWNATTEEIKDFIEEQEPRIKIHSVLFTDYETIRIDFVLNNEMCFFEYLMGN